MCRRSLAALGVVVLLLGAGCAGFLGTGDSAPDRSPYSVPPATPSGTPTPTETATGTDEGSETTTIEPRASIAYRASVADHPELLRRAGDLRLTVSFNWTSGNRTRSIRRVSWTNLTDERVRIRTYLNVSDSTGLEVEELYVEDGTVYRNESGPGDERRYRVVDDQRRVNRILNRTTNVAGRPLVDRTVRLPFERAGTVTVDGERFRRYEATGTDGDVAFVDLANVTAFEATALVDSRGIVRRFEYHVAGYRATGERYASNQTLVIDRVGNTTVDRPDWVARAVESTNATVATSTPAERSNRTATTTGGSSE